MVKPTSVPTYRSGRTTAQGLLAPFPQASAIQPCGTDQELQKWISRQHGFVPESAWILHCKEQFGLVAPGTAPKENPCPPESVAAIQQAFRRFGLM